LLNSEASFCPLQIGFRVEKDNNNKLFYVKTTTNLIALYGQNSWSKLAQRGLFSKQKNEPKLNNKVVFVSQTESTDTHMLI